MMTKSFLISALVILAAGFARAFPENIRHGYMNCTACHVSPSGGGVLTPYGRSLSSELMSTWGTQKVSGFLFSDTEDAGNQPPWFRAQVFLRSVQIKRNNSSVERAQFIPMQGDVEAGAEFEKYAGMVTLGFRAKDASSKNLTEFFSRRHYFLYRATDEWNVRAGKFMFSFGLNNTDHITATRRGLGWDQGTESYNLEATYMTEVSSTGLTAIANSPEEKGIKKEAGFAINQNFLVGKSSKVGFSAYSGEQDAGKRLVFGPQWILSLTEKFYFESELFFQNKKTSVDTQNGFATFHRLGYEAVKGLNLYTQFDRSYLDNSNRSTQFDSYGAGFQWLPFPHFETTTFVGKEQAYGQEAGDFWWVMFNIYL